MIRLCYADDNQQIRLTRYPFWSAENEILSGNKKKDIHSVLSGLLIKIFKQTLKRKSSHKKKEF